MSIPSNIDLITVNIDGREIAVPKGTNMIEAAKLLGIDIPHYCYHPKLSIVGNCRMCLVETGMPAIDAASKQPIIDPATGKQKINWAPRPNIGCGTTASPGLHVRTNTQLVKDCREGVLEFLLINHPLDCPICDQAGECKLQEQSTQYSRGYSRFIEQKNVKPKRTQLGPRVMLDDERCILCSRCIRFCKEIAKDDVLGFTDRGSYSTLSCYPGRQLENNYSLNTVDICPVGALTSTDFRFKMRVWFLKETRSIDTESSVGVNTLVSSREGQIYRITPRRNDGVNDTWMADSGRILYRQVRAENRLLAARIDGQVVSSGQALKAAADLLKQGGVAVVGSGRSSVEEQFLTRKLAEALHAPVSVVARKGEGDGLLISADRNPNTRGALVTGLISALPEEKLSALAAAIDAGEVRTVFSVNEDLCAAGLTQAQLAKVKVVYMGSFGPGSANTGNTPGSATPATIIIPSLTVFEKSGCFINQQFRLQTFVAAVPGPEGVSDDLVTLATLINACGGSCPSVGMPALWAGLSSEIPALAGLNFASIPETGILLDAAPWSSLAFPEGPSLHFKPQGSEKREAGSGNAPRQATN